ncbi:MAG: hypothetical protein GYB65_09635, partial [Chloroflexi bacterium]|nr:hypothetical protein [Chloroflexota bacterium]
MPNQPNHSPDNTEYSPYSTSRRALGRSTDWLPFGVWDVVCYGLLVLVLVAGAWLRFSNQNWDDFSHNHPDERFLTQVVEGMNNHPFLTRTEATAAERAEKAALCAERYPAQTEVSEDRMVTTRPAGFGDYFDADCSHLNPNNLGHGLYVYGEFPLFTTYFMTQRFNDASREIGTFLEAFNSEEAEDYTVKTHYTTYSGVQLVGRSVSATADLLTILVLFLLGRRLYGRWTGLLAAGLYAFAAFPIQQAHFWTVDAFATFWVTLALFMAVRALDSVHAIQGMSSVPYLATWAAAMVWNT